MTGPTMGPQGPALRVEALAREPIVYVRLFGAIDETFDVGELVAAGPGRDIIINTRSIARLSSFGVREWVNGMAALAKVKSRIILVDCSPAMVKQLNLIANFADHCDVVSVQAPYFCSLCGWESELTLKIGESGVEPPPAPMRCPRCSGAVELDEDPAYYFRFAEPNRFRPLDAALAAFIESFHRATPVPGAKVGLRTRLTQALNESRRLARVAAERVGRRWTLALAAAGAVVALVALILLLVVAFRPEPEPGPPPLGAADLLRYHELLAARDYDGALTVVAQLEARGAVPAALAQTLRDDVNAKHVATREAAASEGRRLYAKKRYEEALARFTEAEKLGATGADTDFAVAETLRRLNRLEEADTRYARFLELLGHRSDVRLDDALYWRAEFLVKQNRAPEAQLLLERLITEVPRSNYRRSATRLLKTTKGL